jgi:peptidoglycan/LPS O-acetylase OafA/YrhL
MSSRADYLPTLDGWRAIAVAAVLWHHSVLWNGRVLDPHAIGTLGVDLFFAISGLLITYRMLEEQDRTGEISLRSFYIRRAFRILPAAMLFLGVVSLLSAIGVLPIKPVEILSALFFFRNYAPDANAPAWYTGHYWSLSVEEHFYLIWPTLLIALGVSRARKWTPWLAFAIAVWRTLDSRFHFISAHNLMYGLSRTDYRLDGMLWGCFAALLLHQPAWRERLKRIPAWWSLVAIAFCVALDLARPPQCMVFMAMLFPTVLVATLLHPTGPISRFLELAPLRFIGKISYGIYLWQQLFFTRTQPNILGPIQRLPLNLLCVILVAWLSYRYFEEPLRRYGARLASQRPAGVETPVPTLAASEATP